MIVIISLNEEQAMVVKMIVLCQMEEVVGLIVIKKVLVRKTKRWGYVDLGLVKLDNIS